jgi:hypothetical protein
MATKISVPIRWMMSLLLASVLLVCGQGSARADTTAAEIQRINSIFRAATSINAIPPLQAAIGESNAIDCAKKLKQDVASEFRSEAVDQCVRDGVPAGYGVIVSLVIQEINQSRYVLAGAWTTRAIIQGEAADGTMVVDNNEVGTLTSGSGSARLGFSKCDPPQCDKTYIIYAYSTSAGDRGAGVLLVSDDGCLMYGPYHSNSDPKTIGIFLMARC